jgi:hypothetical protein
VVPVVGFLANDLGHGSDEAWAIAEARVNFRLVAILPGFVLGPALSGRTDATRSDRNTHLDCSDCG